jgi:hypothetical protein
MGSLEKNEGEFLNFSRHQLTSKLVPYFSSPNEKLDTLLSKTVRYKEENTKKEIIWAYEISYITHVILLTVKVMKLNFTNRHNAIMNHTNIYKT